MLSAFCYSDFVVFEASLENMTMVASHVAIVRFATLIGVVPSSCMFERYLATLPLYSGNSEFRQTSHVVDYCRCWMWRDSFRPWHLSIRRDWRDNCPLRSNRPGEGLMFQRLGSGAWRPDPDCANWKSPWMPIWWSFSRVISVKIDERSSYLKFFD